MKKLTPNQFKKKCQELVDWYDKTCSFNSLTQEQRNYLDYTVATILRQLLRDSR